MERIGKCERCNRGIIKNDWLSISAFHKLIHFCSITCMKEYCGIPVEYDPIFNSDRKQ